MDQEKSNDESVESAAVDTEPHAYPEGGLRAWTTVAGSWLQLFASYGSTSSFAVFEDFYAREYLKTTPLSTIGWIGSVQTFLIFSMGLAVAKPFDRGYFYHLLIFGSFLYIFSLFMLSLAQPQHFYQVFLTHGIGCGLGLGITLLPSASIVGHYFSERRPLAMGIAATGSSVGGLVIPILANSLLHGPLGFATSVRIIAAMLGIIGASGICLMRPHFRRTKAGQSVKVSTYTRDKEFLLSIFAAFFMCLATFYPTFYIQLDAVKHNVPTNVAFKLIAILNACAIPGRILPNLLAHRIGVMNVQMLSAISCAVIVFGLNGISYNGSATVIALTALYGFFSGSVFALLVPLLTLNGEVYDLGARTGIGYLFVGLGSLCSSPISGALLGPQYEWWKANVFSAVRPRLRRLTPRY
ncbi:MFS general substrate transporter [Exidia glandulosa HHB12029]|uniref:MFS general substrate transporter n=1 Tax=Exidia glandulosa HHB12029 TaxID=1314781 RepID=A0A165FDT5_EXIGL|nr:MFS general substrate transporter [Exidia glandulosa HHB12029]